MSFLYFSSTIRFPERFYHRLRKIVRIEYNFTIRISSCTTYDLDERRCRTQKSFLISIEYCQQRNFRQIQPFSKKIDTHNDIDDSRFEFFDNLPTIDRSYLTMQIKSFVSFWYKKSSYLFWWLLGKSKKQNSASSCYMTIHFYQEMFEKSWLLILDPCSIYLKKIMYICKLHTRIHPDKNTCGSIHKKWKITIASHKRPYTFDFSMPNNISTSCRQKNEQNI